MRSKTLASARHCASPGLEVNSIDDLVNTKTLDTAIRTHFAANFKNGGVLQKDGRLAVTGANGVVAAVKTIWQWNKDKKVCDLITAVPAK